MSGLAPIRIRLCPDMLAEIDRLVAERGSASRSSLIRWLIVQGLRRECAK